MAQKSIGLIFRDPKLGGKSVEAIFSGLAKYLSKLDRIDVFSDDHSISALRHGKALQRRGFDLYHFTGGAHRLIYLLRGKNILLTVHDIGRLKELQGIRKSAYYYLLMYFPLRIASQVSTVSEFTKRDLLEYFPFLSPQKVRVVYNPLPDHFIPDFAEFDTDCPRILQVGTQPHKNIHRVIEALQGIRCKLVLIGKLNERDIQTLERNRVDYEGYENLTHEQMHAEYRRCDMLIFASLHEGFGMPIIEAQAIGRPVVASDIPSHREVAQDSVAFVSPENVDDIRRIVQSVISDSHLRAQLINSGLENVKRFSLPDIAAQYDALYNEILHNAN